jgi:hypothetical protein
MAYRNGLSISSNANQHINNDFLLKMDFKDFFPSLMPKDLIDHIEKYKYSLRKV